MGTPESFNKDDYLVAVECLYPSQRDQPLAGCVYRLFAKNPPFISVITCHDEVLTFDTRYVKFNVLADRRSARKMFEIGIGRIRVESPDHLPPATCYLKNLSPAGTRPGPSGHPMDMVVDENNTDAIRYANTCTSCGSTQLEIIIAKTDSKNGSVSVVCKACGFGTSNQPQENQ